MNLMEIIKRQKQLIELLQHSEEGMTIKEIAEKLDMSEKTVTRDLQDVEKDWNYDFVDIPAKAHNEKRYKLLHLPPGSTFYFEEAVALALGNRFLSHLENSSLAQSARDGLQKIKEDLPLPLRKMFGNFLNNFYQLSPGWCDYSDKIDIFETLVSACENSFEIEICYAQLEKDEEIFRIAPYAIIMQWGTLYLFGLDVAENVKRTWKVNRIREVAKQTKTFDKPTPAQINAWLKKSFGRFEDKPAQIIKIKATDYMAGYVKEHRWHETQAIINEGTDEAGKHYVIVQFEVVPTPALTDWILALGREGEVLEPKPYRDKVAEIIADMSKKYEKKDHEPQVT